MRKNISFKLFMVTVFFFLLFIVTQLILQSLFFERYFIWRKTTEFETKLKKFEFQYYNYVDDWSKAIGLINEFEKNEDSKIVVLENDGTMSYITKYYDEKNDITKINDVKEIITKWRNDSNNAYNLKTATDIITYTVNNKNYDFKHLVCVSSIKKNGIQVKTIFAITPLNEVSDTIETLSDFYMYFYIVAFVISLILSIIYSRMVSRPLRKVTKTAKKMSRLDFSEKCEVTSQDEIGRLAETLNFLSANLELALNSLKKSNKKLKIDIEKEKKIEKMRREFIASISHELKTPITLIEGYAEGFKDGIFEDEEKDYYIDVILDEARKMEVMVADMLQLSKYESGNIELHIEEFDIIPLINKIIKKMSTSQVNDKKLNLITDFYEKEILVKADIQRIEGVINNFFTNAIRHTQQDGNIYVNIKDDKSRIFIEVENEGSFIPEEEKNKIWNKFYKIDKSGNKKFGGTGLGLAIVKNILELHKSTFGVENTEKGVKFYFSLDK
ncbi:sensor histidine kinase [Clostridium grantii]|uniref:histidine kinase n=1 Tax=Clostridium grantii DSM 8605 TaxID=1121316 RepID=A0A1M5RN18_9CLOT|nr:HAMP domain-containing sensor histidine kinase [Clostridium grantii]SHH27488.1 HAMP domain-containing protein [Clostridium grantii DSM 8605]